jgi:hypothetical protein
MSLYSVGLLWLFELRHVIVCDWCVLHKGDYLSIIGSEIYQLRPRRDFFCFVLPKDLYSPALSSNCLTPFIFWVFSECP